MNDQQHDGIIEDNQFDRFQVEVNEFAKLFQCLRLELEEDLMVVRLLIA
jgi:hypothetical protein